MIDLGNELLYDLSKNFDEQTPEVIDFIRSAFYAIIQYEPTHEIKENVISGYDDIQIMQYNSCETIFDKFARPISAVAEIQGLKVVSLRTYQKPESAWRLHCETLTVSEL